MTSNYLAVPCDDDEGGISLQPLGELITADLAGTPTLDVDQQLRVAALQAAARVWQGAGPGLCEPQRGVVREQARAFEAYLRGDQA